MIVLTILKVIGIVLLVILLLILLILGILLLVPIRYSSNSHKGEANEDYLLGFNAGWFLHFLRFEARYSPDGLNYSLKLLWKTLLSSDDEDDSEDMQVETEPKQGEEDINIEVESDNDVSQLKSKDNEIDRRLQKDTGGYDESNTDAASDTDSSYTCNKDNEVSSALKTKDETAISTVLNETCRENQTALETSNKSSMEVDAHIQDPDTLEKMSSHESNAIHEIPQEEKTSVTDTDTEEPDHINKSPSFSDKFKKKYNSILDKIGDIIKKIRDIKAAIEDEENRTALKLLINKTKYLLRHYRFRKLKGHFTYGSEDPSSVGNLMAFLSLIYPMYGENFFIEPVFDRDILKGELEFKGRIRLIHLLLALIELLLNKKIRRFVFERI